MLNANHHHYDHQRFIRLKKKRAKADGESVHEGEAAGRSSAKIIGGCRRVGGVSIAPSDLSIPSHSDTK